MENRKYKEGDRVIANGGVFWLTITAVMPCGWYDTKFGSIGGRCGTFKEHDLKPYTGV